MNATWTWNDLASERAGGRALPNHIRFLLVTASLAAGVICGEFMRYVAL